MARPSTLLFLLVWISAAWFGSWHWNPNSAVRLFAAIEIAERRDASITRFEHLTIDKARFGSDFYLDKPPGMTVMAAPVVVAVDAATGDKAEGKALAATDPVFDRYMKLRQWIAAAAINATLLALAAVALMDIGRRLTGSTAAGLFGALAFALATPLWGWATTLFGHCAVASLLVIAIRLVLKGTSEDRSRTDAPLTGFTLGWALVIEHSALLFALPIGGFALWRMHGLTQAEARRAITGAVVAGAAAMTPLLGYNLFAFGTPFRLGYQGVVGWEGMNEGLFGLTYPRLSVLAEVLAGTHRGIVWVAPVLLAAVPGLWLLWRRRTRDVALLSIIGALAAFLYNASYVYWDGGNSTGPRHAMSAIAFLALALPSVWAGTGRFGRALLSALLSCSVAINLTIAAAEITAPWSAENALIDGVWRERFWPGYLRTIPNEFFGWTPWPGLALWAVVAGALFAALMIAVTRQPQSANIYRTDGATRCS